MLNVRPHYNTVIYGLNQFQPFGSKLDHSIPDFSKVRFKNGQNFHEFRNHALESAIGSCCLNFDVVLEYKHDSLAFFFYVIWVRFMFYEV